jgi:hypothetical protein
LPSEAPENRPRLLRLLLPQSHPWSTAVSSRSVLAYLTVASAEFVKSLQRCEILIAYARHENVIAFGRLERALIYLLVVVVLALCTWVFCIRDIPATIRRLKNLEGEEEYTDSV